MDNLDTPHLQVCTLPFPIRLLSFLFFNLLLWIVSLPAPIGTTCDARYSDHPPDTPTIALDVGQSFKLV